MSTYTTFSFSTESDVADKIESLVGIRPDQVRFVQHQRNAVEVDMPRSLSRGERASLRKAIIDLYTDIEGLGE